VKRHHRQSLAFVVAALGALACQKSESPSNQPAADAAAKSDVAPDTFRVAFETGRGSFVVEAIRAWAPLGVDRFHELVQSGYYDRVKFFRVLPDFMAQFGIHGDPSTNDRWKDRVIQDDPVTQSNKKGAVTFATGGPNTRTTQLFINTQDNPRLDGMGFAPIGRVVQGMDVVEKLYNGYGEGAPSGAGPSQELANRDGNRYLNRYFPQLDSIVTARIIK
jgi:peptidyl-prolyl cis-trans isomerase A (cyclophilin A)